MTKKCHDLNLAINRHEFRNAHTCDRNLNRLDRLLPHIPVVSESRQHLDLVNPVVNL